jgi:hypothetical protein
LFFQAFKGGQDIIGPRFAGSGPQVAIGALAVAEIAVMVEGDGGDAERCFRGQVKLPAVFTQFRAPGANIRAALHPRKSRCDMPGIVLHPKGTAAEGKRRHAQRAHIAARLNAPRFKIDLVPQKNACFHTVTSPENCRERRNTDTFLRFSKKCSSFERLVRIGGLC